MGLIFTESAKKGMREQGIEVPEKKQRTPQEMFNEMISIAEKHNKDIPEEERARLENACRNLSAIDGIPWKEE